MGLLMFFGCCFYGRITPPPERYYMLRPEVIIYTSYYVSKQMYTVLTRTHCCMYYIGYRRVMRYRAYYTKKLYTHLSLR